MAQRSRAERLGRVRGKRRRVYVIAAVAAAVVAVSAIVVGVAIANHPEPEKPSPAVALAKTGESVVSTTTAAETTATTVPVEVPVLVGLQLADAEMLVKAAGLTLKVTGTPAGDAPVGQVLEQTPAPGQRVTSDTLVELVYAEQAVAVAPTAPSGIVVCIDPGHQAKGNSAQEPVGPGSSETKPKVTSGAAGVVTRQAEHVMVLALSLKIKQRLEAYGVTVVMTRSTANVDISNSQRAAVANQVGADLFLRVHADSNTNADVSGISTLYPDGNEWVQPISAESLKAAGLVQREVLSSTGAIDRGVVARSDLAGFNYATVPSILVETGFLSNPTDDRALATEEYQNRLADGIARGVLEYLGVTR